MSGTVTTAQLIEFAADEKRISAVGQALASEDYDTLERNVSPLLAELAAAGIVYVADANEIPEAYAIPLAWLLGDRCPDLGVHATQSTREAMEDRLKLMVQIQPASSRFLTADNALMGGSGRGYSQARWQRGI